MSIVSRAGDDGGSARLGSARLGPAGCSSTRRSSRLRCSSGGRGGFKAAEQQLSSASGPSAAALPPFRWKSDSVQARFGVGGPLLLLLIFLFHGRRAEAAGRKEGRKKRAGHAGKCSAGPEGEQAQRPRRRLHYPACICDDRGHHGTLSLAKWSSHTHTHTHTHYQRSNRVKDLKYLIRVLHVICEVTKVTR